MNSASICITTFLASLAGSFLPFGSTEVLVVSAAALAPPGLLVPLALLAAAGQMVAKAVVYLVSRGMVQLPQGRLAARMQQLALQTRRWQNTGSLFLLTSATSGLPPFYLISIAAGTLRVPFLRFLVIGLCGRAMRFGVLVALPHALKSAL